MHHTADLLLNPPTVSSREIWTILHFKRIFKSRAQVFYSLHLVIIHKKEQIHVNFLATGRMIKYALSPAIFRFIWEEDDELVRMPNWKLTIWRMIIYYPPRISDFKQYVSLATINMDFKPPRRCSLSDFYHL